LIHVAILSQNRGIELSGRCWEGSRK
jgi:hypothetical protein